MRIDGVTAVPAFRREARRGAAQTREPLQFARDGYILDLTAAAMRHTGHRDMRAARSVPAPPESYNEAGELAYYDPPPRPVKPEKPVIAVAEIDAAPPPRVSFVVFDGMLRPYGISVMTDFEGKAF